MWIQWVDISGDIGIDVNWGSSGGGDGSRSWFKDGLNSLSGEVGVRVIIIGEGCNVSNVKCDGQW